MTTTVEAVYEGGVFRPRSPVPLAEKTRVRLVIETGPSTVAAEDPNGWEAIDELIGFIKDGPRAAIGRDHDEYLYRR